MLDKVPRRVWVHSNEGKHHADFRRGEWQGGKSLCVEPSCCGNAVLEVLSLDKVCAGGG